QCQITQNNANKCQYTHNHTSKSVDMTTSQKESADFNGKETLEEQARAKRRAPPSECRGLRRRSPRGRQRCEVRGHDRGGGPQRLVRRDIGPQATEEIKASEMGVSESPQYYDYAESTGVAITLQSGVSEIPQYDNVAETKGVGIALPSDVACGAGETSESFNEF
ncbi:unnamed protein product, partial [Prorocentrum cordatum]